MRGEGVWAELLAQRLHKACARLGLSRERYPLDLSRFCRPAGSAVGGFEQPERAQTNLFVLSLVAQLLRFEAPRPPAARLRLFRLAIGIT